MKVLVKHSIQEPDLPLKGISKPESDYFRCDRCMQDENAHLNGGAGSDSASEVAESGPDDDADDAELSDDQDEEVDDAYMQQLAREARKLKVRLPVAWHVEVLSNTSA